MLLNIIPQIKDEINKAQLLYTSFHSMHEGFAVLKEEVDELWDCVKMKQNDRKSEVIEKECIQIAAMAIRIILDCGKDGYKK